MKYTHLLLFVNLFFLIQSVHSADFFHLEHLPQGTKIPVLKLVNLIPSVKNTPIKDAQLEDVYVQAVAETPAVYAHIELLGKIKLKTSLPGLQNIGDLDLSVIAKFFSAFGRGAAPLSSPLPSPEVQSAQKAAQDFKKGEQIFGISPSEEAEFMSEEPTPFGYGEIEVESQSKKLIQPTLAILPQLPGGENQYTENPQGLLVEKQPEVNQPPKVFIKSGDVYNAYVLLDPTAVSEFKTKQQVQQYIAQLEELPLWFGLVREARSRPYSLAPYIKQAQVAIPENQIKYMTIVGGGSVYKPWDRNIIYVKIEGNNYMALSDKVFTNPEFSQKNSKALINAVKQQNLEFKNQRQILSKTFLPIEEIKQTPPAKEQKPAPPLPTLSPNQVADIEFRFQEAIKALQQELSLIPDDPDLTNRLKLLAYQYDDFKKAPIKSENQPILIEEEGIISKQQRLIPERKAYLSRYNQAIRGLRGLSSNLATSEEVQNLINALVKEKGRLAEPEVTLNALKQATRYLEREKVIPPSKAIALLPEQFAQEDITAIQNRFTKVLNELDRRIAIAQPDTQKTLKQHRELLAYAQVNFQRRISGPRDAQGKVKISPQIQLQFLPTLAGEEFNLEYTLVSKPGQTTTPAPQAPATKFIAPPSISPAQAFAREVGRDEVLYREEDPIWKFRIASLPTPSGTAGAGKFVVIESPTGKEYLFDSATVIGAGFTKEQLEQYVAARETQTVSQQQPITVDAANKMRKQMVDALSKLQLLPRKTEYETNLINTLNQELSQLNRLGTLPSVAQVSEFSGLQKAEQLLERIGTPPPPEPPLKEKVTAATERTKKQVGVISGQVKEKIAVGAERAKAIITALPAQIQEEYKAARAALSEILIQKRSEIARVGAALFLITLQNPNYRPFQNIQIPDLPPIDVPGIKDIELNNTELGVFLAPPNVFSIWAQGTGRVINIPLLAKVLFNYEKMQDPNTGRMVDNNGVVLQAGLPEAWKFSDSFPNMKDWDRFQIKRAYVYVSTINYIDYTIPTQLMPSASISIANVPGRPTVGMLPGITIRPGLSLYGEINLRKLIPEIFEHLNFAGVETASLYGTISYKPENCQLGIGLPDLIKIENSPFKLGGVWAEIHAKNMPTGPAPEASIVIALVIQPSPKDETLTFTARASSDLAGGIVAFSMQGFWNNALGVEGLSIGDLALQLHTDYKALFAGVPISGGGFTGTFKFGTQTDSTIIKFASLFASTSTGQEVAIQAKLDGTLSIWQIIDGCKSLAINKAQQDKKSTKAVEDNYNKILNNVVAKQLGNVAIRNTEFKVAPSTVRIGEFFILQGFTAKGELTLLGATAGLDFNLGQSGVTATGYLSPIKVGDVFSLTGAGLDKQYGTLDDAATISLALNFLKQHLIITGQVKLLGIEQKTDIFIDTEGLNCTISGKIFNLYDTSVVLKSRGDITNPDLYFKASMKQEFTKYIVDETIKALHASTQDSVNKIKAAQDEINKINTNITDLDKQIADHKKRIDELSKVAAQAPKTSPEITKLSLELPGLEAARIATIDARNDAQKILAGSQDAINKFNAAQQEVNKLNSTIADFDNQISSRKRRIDELGKNFLEGVKNAPEITKLGIEIAGFETGKAGAVAARDTATGVLKSMSSTATILSTNQGQIDNLNREIARLDQQIVSHKQQIDTLSKQFVQGAQTTPEITKLGLELTGLETAKAGAITSRETAKAALEGVKRWVGGASTIAEAFIQHAAVPLDIRESTLEASVQDIAKGKLPRFTATAIILGKKLNLDMQLDFSSPEKAQQSANAIAQQILTLFK